MDPPQGRASPPSKRCRSPISRRSSPPPARRCCSPPSTRPMRSTASWCRPPPSSCSDWWRWARSPQHCCTGRRSPVSASPAPSSRRSWCPPTSRTSGRSTSISRSSPRRPSVWRGCGCGAGLRSPPSCSRCCGPSPACNAARRWSAPHAFHVHGRLHPRRAARGVRLHVRPARGTKARSSRSRPARSRPISLGATLIVLNSFHADAAMIVFGLLVAGSLIVAWRSDAATGAVGAAAALVFVVFAEWAIRANAGHAGAARRTAAGHRTERHRRIGVAAPDHRRRSSRPDSASPDFLAQGRSVSADHSGDLVGGRGVHAAGASGRALCPHRASRPLDPVRHSGGAAGRSLCRRDRDPDQARRPAGPAGLDRAVCHRHARRAGAGIDLRAGKRLAHDRAGADVARHRLDLDAAADPVPALARRDPRRHRGDARSPTSRASSATPSAPRRSSTGCCGVTAFRRPRSGPAASSCAAAATMRRCARWKRPRSCSPCCWRSWRSAMPSTMAIVYRQQRRPHRSRAAGLRRAGDGDRAGAAAPAHRQRRAQCRRRSCSRSFAGLATVFGLLLLENPMLWPIDVGGALHQPAAARLRAACRAGAAVVLCGGRPSPGRLRQHDRRRRADPGARLCDVRNPQALSRPGHGRRPDHRRRAIHLFDRLAGVRRGAARHRHPRQLAARAAGLRRRDRADDPESLRDRHVDADGRLPRAVVHVPRPGAGGDRLAVPADPVPQAGGRRRRPGSRAGS